MERNAETCLLVLDVTASSIKDDLIPLGYDLADSCEGLPNVGGLENNVAGHTVARTEPNCFLPYVWHTGSVCSDIHSAPTLTFRRLNMAVSTAYL